MSQLVKLVGSGIGLASEAYKASKSSNTNRQNGESSRNAASQSIPNEAPPEYVEVPEAEANELIARGQAIPVDSKEAEKVSQHEYGSASEEDDEEIWALDDAASSGAEREDATEPPKESKAIADIFLKNHPPPAIPVARAQFPCTVIIPQRRPKDKKRGFVRAYAPVLADCGIDQAAFLDFLKSFQQASKADPWLNVVNVAAFAAGMVPSITAMAVSAAVQVAVGVAMEVQRRARFVESPIWTKLHC
jgi:hypothetical protein